MPSYMGEAPSMAGQLPYMFAHHFQGLGVNNPLSWYNIDDIATYSGSYKDFY